MPNITQHELPFFFLGVCVFVQMNYVSRVIKREKEPNSATFYQKKSSGYWEWKHVLDAIRFEDENEE